MQRSVRIKAGADPATLMFATHLTFGAAAPEVIPGGGRLRPELSLEQGPLAGTIEHARCDLGEGADSACGTTHERVTYRMRCRVKDHLGDVLRRVHGRRELRLSASIISYVLRHRGADRGGLDQCDRDWRTFFLKLHAERVRKALNRVLGRRVDALQRNGAIRCHAADVDQRAAMLPELGQGNQRAINLSPEVRFKELTHIRLRELLDPTPNADAGVVHPGIDTAKGLNGLGCEALKILAATDIANQSYRPAPFSLNFPDRLVQRLPGPPCEHYGCALRGCHSRRRQPNAARCAGDDDNLIGQAFEPNCHCFSPIVNFPEAVGRPLP